MQGGKDMWAPKYKINNRTLVLLEKISNLRSKIQMKGIRLPSMDAVKSLLRIIQEKEIMGIRDIAQAIKTTVPGAHYVLRHLLKHGVIVRVGRYKNVKYTLPNSTP